MSRPIKVDFWYCHSPMLRQLRVILGKKDALAEVNQKRVRLAVSEAKQDRFPYLHHVGQVNDATEMAANIEINNTMLMDQIPTEYKEIFTKMVSG